MVLLKSSAAKAFCAGGDVRELIGMIKENPAKAREYFRMEYGLDYAVATSKTPIVALMNGITMGGGCGISVHAPFRVATETTLMAMPETRIGLFPDVGSTFFLSRMDGELGVYLGLTGDRLKGEDAFHIGLATHYVPSSQLPSLERDLCELDTPDSEVINQVIQEYSEESEQPFSLDHARPVIDKCFRYDTMEEIIQALTDVGDEFSKQTLETLGQMSPTSLKITLKSIRAARTLSIADAFKMEYKLALKCLGHDFPEGVTKQLVTKTRDPQWKPATLAEVPLAEVEKYFNWEPSEPLEIPDELTYMEYPHLKNALPSEREVQHLLSGENPDAGSMQLDRAAIMTWFETDRMEKPGVTKKVLEILSRKTAVTAEGQLKWTP
ncbi:ClpP/crotonase [Basidiobolus meristosporus CBS 931.73]|uniref:3-hydroxyisobutyryl-CoA hydrolase n=1 Tax=Basidiobolus meristosporus CBS 931.73 TaxID=1314790 RepID=A0A1Y1Z3G9_9FUNG|nr:ClpP/crotonase [Basidiobolus meristosporus CBS 931.73]|eukprot:ORY04405.1 ClpP/crotonase [Basidiobolus meristosporus CBS 931.73]